jgi:hypothetical protein
MSFPDGIKFRLNLQNHRLLRRKPELPETMKNCESLLAANV